MAYFELTNGEKYRTLLTDDEFLELLNSDKQFIILDLEYTHRSDNYHRDYDIVTDEKLVINKNQILKFNIY